MTQLPGYRELLKSQLLKTKRELGSIYTIDRMAKACGVAKTYLSRALNGHVHLSSDQVFLCCDFLHLPVPMWDYLVALHEYERSTAPARRTLLARKVAELRERLAAEGTPLGDVDFPAGENALSRYFTDPKIALAHLLLHLPANAASPQRLQSILGASQRRVAEILAELRRCGFLKSEVGGKVKVLPVNAHLPQTSPLFHAYRKLQRLVVLERLDEAPDPDDVTFNASFCADRATAEWLKARIDGLLRETHERVRKAPGEKVYQLTIDFFAWD